jgi:glycosyltransferase involved in cell wall biosynthesis
MRPLRIGIIAPPWIPVPPPAYGGIEQVVAGLVRCLAQRGHTVHLVAAPGSSVPVGHRLTCPLRDVPSAIGDVVPDAAHVGAAYEALEDEDIILDHTGLAGAVAGSRARPPVLHVIHGALDAASLRAHQAVSPPARWVAISRAQSRTARGLDIAAVCWNGIEVAAMPFTASPGSYLAFVGRMAPEKGVEAAIRIARWAGVPLRMAAKCREPGEKAFFDHAVRPLMDGGVEWLGEVTVAERNDLLAGASALVFPISWAEPFGMVMIEAMACGTPVLATPRGAVPEVVRDGVTGYVRDVDELIGAVAKIPAIDRAACRRHVEQAFSDEAMTSGYERAMCGVLEGELLGVEAPEHAA